MSYEIPGYERPESCEIPVRIRCSGLCAVHCDGQHEISLILGLIALVDAHLDEAGPQWAKDCPEANMYRRVGKAQLEAAEAMEELSLATGENPRKGRHPEARERMLAELGDTVVAGLLGIQSQLKDTAATWTVFRAALAKAASRVPDSGDTDRRAAREGGQH